MINFFNIQCSKDYNHLYLCSKLILCANWSLRGKEKLNNINYRNKWQDCWVLSPARGTDILDQRKSIKHKRQSELLATRPDADACWVKKERDNLIGWCIQGCLCFVLCKQLQANLVNAPCQEKAMCDQGRVRVSSRMNGPCLLSSPALEAFVQLQKQSFFDSDQMGNEFLFVCGAQPTPVHMAGLRREWGTTPTGELLIDSMLISSTLLAAVKKKDYILGKVVN